MQGQGQGQGVEARDGQGCCPRLVQGCRIACKVKAFKGRYSRLVQVQVRGLEHGIHPENSKSGQKIPELFSERTFESNN